MSKILMVAPGRKTNGGITKVVSYYENSSFWKKEDVIWIETHCSGNAILKLLAFVKGLILFLKYARKAKIAHIHFAGGNSARRKYIFFLLSKIFNLKIVSHLHEPGGFDFNLRENWAFNRIILKSTAVLVLSKVWKEILVKKYNRDFFVLNNPSLGFINNNFRKQKKILFAGSLIDRKGYKDLIHALALVNPILLRGYEIVIAGDGDILAAEKLLNDLKLNNIIITGWLDEKAILSQFKSAEIFVLPSYAEGFPISIIDALSNACAIITTPVGGIADILENNINCLFVEPGDVDLLSSAISQLLKNKKFIGKLSLNSLQLAKQEFDVSIITSKLSDIYKSLR